MRVMCWSMVTLNAPSKKKLVSSLGAYHHYAVYSFSCCLGRIITIGRSDISTEISRQAVNNLFTARRKPLIYSSSL